MSLAKEMDGILVMIAALPKKGPSSELAAGITILGDFEKVLRKTRAGWMAALIEQASQPELPLAQQGGVTPLTPNTLSKKGPGGL